MILQGNYTSSHQISGKRFSVTDKETLDRLTGKADGSVWSVWDVNKCLVKIHYGKGMEYMSSLGLINIQKK